MHNFCFAVTSCFLSRTRSQLALFNTSFRHVTVICAHTPRRAMLQERSERCSHKEERKSDKFKVTFTRIQSIDYRPLLSILKLGDNVIKAPYKYLKLVLSKLQYRHGLVYHYTFNIFYIRNFLI